MTILTFAPRVDFPRVLMDLEGRGYTHGMVAAAIGGARSTVEGWKNKGARPAHEQGERLIALWCTVTARASEELPRLASHALSAAKVEREARGPADQFAAPTVREAALSVFSATRGWAAAAAQQ